MPTAFLDIPQEIRDEIYEYVFSTTGLIEVTAIRYDKKDPMRTSSSRLMRTQKTLSADNEAIQVDNGAEEARLSLSLRRTCRQFYRETNPYFWSKNTFYFASLAAPQGSLTTLIDPKKLFRSLGQRISRLITSISINIPGNPAEFRRFPGVIGCLTSRARRGDFRRLELVLTKHTMEKLQESLLKTYELGKTLGTGRHACQYERIMRIPRTVDYMNSIHPTLAGETLHRCFGGKLYWGDELVGETKVG